MFENSTDIHTKKKCLFLCKKKAPKAVIFISLFLFVCLFGFYGISTFVSYLMSNLFLHK